MPASLGSFSASEASETDLKMLAGGPPSDLISQYQPEDGRLNSGSPRLRRLA